MSKLGFIKRHYKASLLFVASCIVLLSLGFNMIIPFFDKRFNQDKVAPEQKELEPLGVTYGTMPAAVTDSYEYQGSKGEYTMPHGMLRLGNSEYYIIAHQDSFGTSDGFINSTKVENDDGTITESTIDYLDFETVTATFPNLCNVYDDIYAVFYGTANKLNTFSADDADGSIGAATIDSLTATYPLLANDIIKVSGNMFAVVYSNSTYNGIWLQTVYIDNSGNIPAAWNASYRINTSSKYMSMASVDSNTIVIAYNGSGMDGYLVTFDINTITGAITKDDEWEFAPDRAEYLTIKKVSSNVFAVAFTDNTLDTEIRTFTISSTGVITRSAIDSLIIDVGTDYFPSIFTINNGSVYGVTYKVSDADGWIKTFNMSASGIIGASTIDSLEFDAADNKWYAPVIWVNKSWYYIAYTGTDSDGWSCTVSIDTNYASPTFSNPSPANNSVGQALTPQCAITVNDLNGDTMTVNFYENSTGSYVLRQTNSSCANGTYRWTFTQASSYSLKYYWKVYINDGTHNVSNWYCFTTLAPPDQEPTWQSLFNSTLTGGNISNFTPVSLWTSTLTGGNETSIYKSLFTSTLTGGNVSTLKPNSLFTSTLTGGNTTSYASLFISLLTGGNVTTASSLWISTLTGGNITSYKSLFTSLLTGGNTTNITIILSDEIPVNLSTVTLSINASNITGHSGDIWFSIQRNHTQGLDMNTSIWFNGSFLLTNLTWTNGSISFWLFDYYNGTIVSGHTYNWTVNCSRGSDYLNETYMFDLIVTSGVSSSMNTRDRFTLGLVLGSMVFLMIGFILFRRRKK